MAEPTEPVRAEVPDLHTVARQRVRDALLADPRAVEILKLLPRARASRSPAESFLCGFEEQMELLRSADQDGTLDILVEVGGAGDLNERIREVRTQAAVMRSVLRESAPSPLPVVNPTPAPATEPVQRRPRKNVNGGIIAALAGNNAERLHWSAATWARFLGCSAGTVKGTEAWKTILDLRKGECRSRRG